MAILRWKPRALSAANRGGPGVESRPNKSGHEFLAIVRAIDDINVKKA
jgi:hypothetical protein